MRFVLVVFLVCFIFQEKNFIDDQPDDVSYPSSSSSDDSDSSYELVHKKKEPPQTRSKSERDVNIKARDYLKEIIDLSKTEVMYVEDFNMFNRTHRKDFGKAVDGVLYVNMQDMKENAQVMRMYDFLCNYYVTYKDTEGVFPIMPNWNTNERVEVVHMVDQFLFEYDPAWLYETDFKLQDKESKKKKQSKKKQSKKKQSKKIKKERADPDDDAYRFNDINDAINEINAAPFNDIEDRINEINAAPSDDDMQKWSDVPDEIPACFREHMQKWIDESFKPDVVKDEPLRGENPYAEECLECGTVEEDSPAKCKQCHIFECGSDVCKQKRITEGVQCLFCRLV